MKQAILYSFIILLFAACGGKTDLTPQEMISGTSSKIWKASKEYDTAGDKVGMSDEEKEETMRFYPNGNFSMQSDADMANGTWSYEAGANNLKLVFEGDDHSENFNVTKMSTDEITLVAGDGSKLILSSE